MTTHDLQDRLSDLEAELEAYKRAKAENDECYMIERDQARLELQSLKAQVADREKLANEVTDTAETLTEELQSLKAQNAAMREALDTLKHAIADFRHNKGWNCSLDWLIDLAEQALSTTQPSSPRSLGATYHGPYVSVEAVGPLLLDAITIMGMVDPVKYADVWTSRAALQARARELGLLGSAMDHIAQEADKAGLYDAETPPTDK